MRLIKKQIDALRDVFKIQYGWNNDAGDLCQALCDMAYELLAYEAADERMVAAANYRASRAGEACNEWKRRAESSEALMDNNIRDLRDICETLAKRIAALEAKPSWPTPSRLFWRESIQYMSPEERKGQRRIRRANHWRNLGTAMCEFTLDGKWQLEKRHKPDRRQATARTERRRHWVADRRQCEPTYAKGPRGLPRYNYYDGAYWQEVLRGIGAA